MSVAERLARPPATRTTAVAWSAAAAFGFLFGIFGSQVLLLPSDTEETRILVSNLTGLVGQAAFIPFLRAVHAAVRRTGVPAGLMAAAYGLLIVRLIVLVPFFLQGSDLPEPVGTTISILFFALVGAAAACAAVAWLPSTPEARAPLRMGIVGVSIGILVSLMVLTGTGLVLIVVSLALALINAFRAPADPA